MSALQDRAVLCFPASAKAASKICDYFSFPLPKLSGSCGLTLRFVPPAMMQTSPSDSTCWENMSYSQLIFSNGEKMTSCVKGFPIFMPQFTQQDKYDCQKKSKN